MKEKGIPSHAQQCCCHGFAIRKTLTSRFVRFNFVVSLRWLGAHTPDLDAVTVRIEFSTEDLLAAPVSNASRRASVEPSAEPLSRRGSSGNHEESAGTQPL